MRFRTDGWHYADLKSQGWRFGERGETGGKVYGAYFDNDAEFEEVKKAWNETPPAQPGDVWRVRWYRQGVEPGPIAGYAICCLGCGYVHSWTSARNCNAPKRQYTYKDLDGNEKTGEVCIHSGERSCWDWSGSAEEGTLTAAPSLLVCGADTSGGGKCNWHGFIQSGDIHE